MCLWILQVLPRERRGVGTKRYDQVFRLTDEMSPTVTREDESMSVFEKFDIDLYRTWQKEISSETPEREPKPEKTRGERIMHRIIWLAIDTVASMIWVYAFLKLFVGDFDRWVVGSINPSLLWLIDYRFFFLLALFTVAVLVLRKAQYLLPVVYVLFFPLILIVWKIPRVYYRSGNWMLVLGTLQIAWSVLRSLRFAVVGFSLVVFSSLILRVSSWPFLLFGVATTMGLLWVYILGRAVVSAPRPSRFVKAQQTFVVRALSNENTRRAVLPGPELTHPSIVKYNKAQADNFVMKGSMGVALYGTGHVLADQLEKYRTSGISVVFSAASVVTLILQAVILLSIGNLALLRADPSQFELTGEVKFAGVVRYTFNSLFLSEIDAMQPVGVFATTLNILAGLSVAVIALVLVVSIVFGIRQSKDDENMRIAIDDMRKKSDEFARVLVEEYRVPMKDLVQRMIEAGGMVGFWLKFFGSVAVNVRGFEDAEWPNKK